MRAILFLTLCSFFLLVSCEENFTLTDTDATYLITRSSGNDPSEPEIPEPEDGVEFGFDISSPRLSTTGIDRYEIVMDKDGEEIPFRILAYWNAMSNTRITIPEGGFWKITWPEDYSAGFYIGRTLDWFWSSGDGDMDLFLKRGPNKGSDEKSIVFTFAALAEYLTCSSPGNWESGYYTKTFTVTVRQPGGSTSSEPEVDVLMPPLDGSDPEYPGYPGHLADDDSEPAIDDPYVDPGL